MFFVVDFYFRYVILMALSWLFFVPVRSLRIFSFYSQVIYQHTCLVHTWVMDFELWFTLVTEAIQSESESELEESSDLECESQYNRSRNIMQALFSFKIVESHHVFH